jgi:hypothetical protein
MERDSDTRRKSDFDGNSLRALHLKKNRNEDLENVSSGNSAPKTPSQKRRFLKAPSSAMHQSTRAHQEHTHKYVETIASRITLCASGRSCFKHQVRHPRNLTLAQGMR